MSNISYNEMDQNVIRLVGVINEFPGIVTTSSCGGHPNPENYQQPAGEWQIFLELETGEDDRPTREAWCSVELLAFAFTKVFHGIGLRLVSADPFLNGIGDSMSFVIDGNTDPDTVAAELSLILEEFTECQEG